MNIIYFMSEGQQLFLLFFSCLLAIIQAYIFCLASDINRPRKKLVLCQEAIILGFVLLVSMSMNIAIISLQQGNISLGRYDTVRYIIGALTVSTTIWGIQTKSAKILLIATVLLSLPWTDNNVLCCFAALLFWTLRNYLVFKRIKQFRQEQVTATAIKEAIDYLPIGMIFAYENGEIFLANVSALKYMYGNFNHYFGDIISLWNASIDFPQNKYLVKQILGKDLFLRLSSSCSLLLSLTTLNTPHGKVQQMLINNVTEEDQYNLQLSKQNAALAASGAELKKILGNLEAVTRQQIATKLRFYVHDLMGQRLTILQQLLYDEKNINYEEFTTVLDEISQDLRKINVQTAEDKLANILSTYKNIGIKVQVTGSLPEDKTLADTFVAIIREGITNAVRHGHCDTVNIQLQTEKDKFMLNIADNGIGCPKYLVFGTGLKGIADRLNKVNGILSIKKKPFFAIHCEVQDGNY